MFPFSVEIKREEIVVGLVNGALRLQRIYVSTNGKNACLTFKGENTPEIAVWCDGPSAAELIGKTAGKALLFDQDGGSAVLRQMSTAQLATELHRRYCNEPAAESVK